jgi:hypothetical protein
MISGPGGLVRPKSRVNPAGRNRFRQSFTQLHKVKLGRALQVAQGCTENALPHLGTPIGCSGWCVTRRAIMGMRVSSSSSGAASGAAAYAQRQQSMQALTQALKSNNLDEAKAAFTKMSAHAPAAAVQNPNSAMAQLGKALQAGNLGSAQQAFAAMRSHAPAPSQTAAASKPTATHGNFLDVMA